MKRRKFLSTSVATVSAIAMAKTTSLSGMNSGIDKKEDKYIVTILKKEYYKEFYLKFKGKKGKPCHIFDVGQKFIITKNSERPDNFCKHAWNGVLKSTEWIVEGEHPNTVTCCADGFRPVIFGIEKIVN